MKNLIICLQLVMPFFLTAQSAGGNPFVLHLRPVFEGRNLDLHAPLRSDGSDSLALHTLRFYLGNFVFMKKGAVVLEEKRRYRLLDLEDVNSLDLTFDFPGNADFDSLVFDLGVDSLTTTSGAMGGDLDPTKGMFWTWQSGYINVKIEGFYKKCPARNHAFQFHLGGYLTPFQSARTVQIKVVKDWKPSGFQLELDLSPFFENVDWANKHSIMSPSGEAVRLSEILAKSFRLYAP